MKIELTEPAVHWLRLEYEARAARNMHYSLRAFARDLKKSPGPLSEIFQMKRSLTQRLAEQMAKSLFLSSIDQQKFIELTAQARSLVPPRNSAQKALEQKQRQLSDDTFSLISDWYHYALLSLMEIKDFPWI